MERIKIHINQELKNRLDSKNKKIFAKAQEELIEKVVYEIYDGDEPIKIMHQIDKFANIYLNHLYSHDYGPKL